VWVLGFFLLVGISALCRPAVARFTAWRVTRERNRLQLTRTGITVVQQPYGEALTYAWPDVGQVTRVWTPAPHPYQVVLNSGVLIPVHEIESPHAVLATMKERGMPIDPGIIQSVVGAAAQATG
jgi:hypothetical protein